MVEGRVLYESALAKALFHLSMSEGLIVPEKWGAAAGEATTAAAAAADTIFGFDLCQNFWAFDLQVIGHTFKKDAHRADRQIRVIEYYMYVYHGMLLLLA